MENPAILLNHNYSYDENIVRKEIDNIKVKLSENIDTFLKSLQKQELIQPKLLEI